MTHPTRRLALAAALAAGLATAAPLAQAQAPFPDKPLRIMVGASAGGGTDILARTWPVDTLRLMVPAPAGGGVDILCRQLADRLAPLLGANVVIENKPGAGGLLGARALAGSPADGSSVGYLHAGHLTVQAMGGKLDLATEFTPVVGRFSASQFVICVVTEAPQQTAYADTLRRLGRTGWVAVIDIDEFLVLRYDRSIGQFLDRYRDPP